MTPTRIALNRYNSGARLHWLMAGYVTRADPDRDTAMMVTLKNALDDIEGDIWTTGVLSHFPYVKTTEYNPGLLLQSPKPSFQKMSEVAAPLDELVNFQRLDGLFPHMHVSEHHVVDDRGSDMHVRPRWIGKLTGNVFRNDTMCVRQDELEVGVVYIVSLTYAVLPVTFALFADSAQCVALQVHNDMLLRDLGRVVIGDTTLGSRKVVAGTPVRLVLSHGKDADELTEEKKCVVYDLVFPVNYADSIQHLKPDADEMLPSWQTIPACMLDRKLSPTAFVATSVLIRVGVDVDTKTSKPNGNFMFFDDKYPTIAAYTEAQS